MSMNSLQRTVLIANEKQKKEEGDSDGGKGGGGGGGGGETNMPQTKDDIDPRMGDGAVKRRLTNRRLESLVSTTTRGRTATINSETPSESDASTTTTRRIRPTQRDQLAGMMSMKRGSTLYFGKDISTSMWWKYRQVYDGVGALRGAGDTFGNSYPVYENSYRLEPKFGHKFSPGKIEKCIQEVIDCFFVNETYDPKKAVVLAAAMSDTVKQKVKMLSTFDRYRFVVNVDIGSRVPGQEVVFASRYLWNADTDGFATVTGQNPTMYVVVTVYGVYFD